MIVLPVDEQGDIAARAHRADADYLVRHVHDVEAVEQDYEAFRAATRTGRFPVETQPSAIEQAIR